jgi:hypothetical protein
MIDAMTSLATRPVLDGPSQEPRRRNSALGLSAICLGFLMITLDATIVNLCGCSSARAFRSAPPPSSCRR